MTVLAVLVRELWETHPRIGRHVVAVTGEDAEDMVVRVCRILLR